MLVCVSPRNAIHLLADITENDRAFSTLATG